MHALADTAHLAGAAWADRAVRLDHPLAARKVFGQRPDIAVCRLARPARRGFRRLRLVVVGRWRARVGDEIGEIERHLLLRNGANSFRLGAEVQRVDGLQRRP
jgi:hypothetical protein